MGSALGQGKAGILDKRVRADPRPNKPQPQGPGKIVGGGNHLLVGRDAWNSAVLSARSDICRPPYWDSGSGS